MVWNINSIFCVVLSFTYCYAKICLNITVKSHGDIDVNFSGDDTKIITENEIRLFGLNYDDLKWGVRVELGRIPDEVFLKNPTPYGDLYTEFKWQEVKRKLKVKSANVLDVLKENTILKTNVFINNATESIKTKGKIYQRVENTVYSLWSAGGLPKDEIVYDLNINFGREVLSYKNNWRNSTIRNIYLPFGISKKGEVIITSGKEIVIQLSAVKVIAVIEVIYEAYLTGQLIANYARVYGKYHFWAPTIGNIMTRVDIKNQIETREVIEIRCYSDPGLNIFDKLTGETVKIVISPKSS